MPILIFQTIIIRNDAWIVNVEVYKSYCFSQNVKLNNLKFSYRKSDLVKKHSATPIPAIHLFIYLFRDIYMLPKIEMRLVKVCRFRRGVLRRRLNAELLF